MGKHQDTFWRNIRHNKLYTRPVGTRRLYNMQNMVIDGDMTNEQADKIVAMLLSDDPEIEKLGELSMQPFLKKKYDRYHKMKKYE